MMLQMGNFHVMFQITYTHNLYVLLPVTGNKGTGYHPTTTNGMVLRLKMKRTPAEKSIGVFFMSILDVTLTIQMIAIFRSKV